MLIIRVSYTISFPGSITAELKSERELSELQRNAGRQKEISSFIIKSIENLNGQTCALDAAGNQHLCDSGIKDGISKLLEPVLNN